MQLDSTSTVVSDATSQQQQRGGRSVLDILRQRWWLIALVMLGAVGVTLAITLTAPPVYRSTVRLQAFALDDQGVTLFTRAQSVGVGEQIATTQTDFKDVLESPLIAWRTIGDLNLEISADDLLRNLSVGASGDFVTVSYEGRSPQETTDVLNQHVKNALDYFNSARARPASATGQFIQGELARQDQTLKAAQAALLQFQLEHNVGDLQREINATQDVLRGLEADRNSATVAASRADAMARQWQVFTEQAEESLKGAREQLIAVLGQPIPEAQADRRLLEQRVQDARDAVTTLEEEVRSSRSVQQAQIAEAAAARAALAEHQEQINERNADLAQLISLSSQYNDLLGAVETAQADFDFLRGKAAEARLKQNQVANVGTLQVVEPAFLPTEPATAPVVRLTLLALLVSLLVGLVLVLLLELASPARPPSGAA